MAATAAVIAAKAALAAVSDKRVRTFILSVVVGIIGGIFILIGALFSIGQGSQQSNQRALGYIFNTHPFDIAMWDIPEEYREELVSAKGRVAAVMGAVDDINADIDGVEIDRLKAGTIYLCVFPNGETTDYAEFAWCFAQKEGEAEIASITDESTIYSNIRNKFGISISSEQLENIAQTYTFLTTGGIFLAPIEYTGPPGEAYTDETFAQLMGESVKYIGFPYVFGGSSPSTSFDCSGFVCYVYTTSGVRNLPRTTAQGIFNQCAVISRSELKPGIWYFLPPRTTAPNR